MHDEFILQYQLPILIMVLDNSGWGAVKALPPGLSARAFRAAADDDLLRAQVSKPGAAWSIGDDGTRHTDAPELPWRDLRRTFLDAGWCDLTNTRADLLTIIEDIEQGEAAHART